jgi:hypothetical protein
MRRGDPISYRRPTAHCKMPSMFNDPVQRREFDSWLKKAFPLRTSTRLPRCRPLPFAFLYGRNPVGDANWIEHKSDDRSSSELHRNTVRYLEASVKLPPPVWQWTRGTHPEHWQTRKSNLFSVSESPLTSVTLSDTWPRQSSCELPIVKFPFGHRAANERNRRCECRLDREVLQRSPSRKWTQCRSSRRRRAGAGCGVLVDRKPRKMIVAGGAGRAADAPRLSSASRDTEEAN